MTRSLLFSCLIALCALAFRPFDIRAEEKAPATKAKPKYVKWKVSEFSTYQIEWALGPADSFLSGSKDGYIRLWEIATQQMFWQIKIKDGVTPAAIAFSGADQETGEAVVVLVTGEVLVLRLKDGSEVRRFKIQLNDLTEQPEDLWKYTEARVANNMLLTVSGLSSDLKSVRTWSLTDGAPLQKLDVQQPIEVALSPDGARVAWVTMDEPNPYRVFIAPTADLSRASHIGEKRSVSIDAYSEYEAFNRHPDLLFFSPDGAMLAHLASGSMSIWNISGAEAKPPRTSIVPKLPSERRAELDPELEATGYYHLIPRAASFSADGKYLFVQIECAAAAGGITALFSFPSYYDTKTGEEVKVPEGAAWSGNATTLPSVKDGVVRLDNPSNFLTSKNSLNFFGVTFPPDEKLPLIDLGPSAP